MVPFVTRRKFFALFFGVLALIAVVYGASLIRSGFSANAGLSLLPSRKS